MVAPSLPSGATHTLLTSAVEPSLFFQWSHGLPSASTNGIGSIDPPWSSWQIIGPPDASMNGPMGEPPIATLMHHLPADATRAA